MNQYLLQCATIAFLLPSVCGCGGRVVIDPVDTGTIQNDADDAGDAIDGGDAGAISSLPPCKSFDDCDGYAVCQEGFCCNGSMISGECVCGNGAGCDLLHVCCVPIGGQSNGVKECVDYASMCYQP